MTPLEIILIAISGMLAGALIGAAIDRRRLAREVQHLQGRLAEARTARLDLLVYLDRASSSAAVMRRQRDAVLETAAGVAKLAQLDALREHGHDVRGNLPNTGPT